MESKYLITEENIVIKSDCDELLCEADYINAYVEAWFDVDRRFGTETANTDDYINVYANYFTKTKELELSYIIKYADGDESDEIVVDLEQSEKEAIFKVMDKEFRREYGCGMKDYDPEHFLEHDPPVGRDFFATLNKDELVKIMTAYGQYIQEANEDNRYAEGWYPVCISEFIDNEYAQLLADDEMDWGD